jgi:hypothetical protein
MKILRGVPVVRTVVTYEADHLTRDRRGHDHLGGETEAAFRLEPWQGPHQPDVAPGEQAGLLPKIPIKDAVSSSGASCATSTLLRAVQTAQRVGAHSGSATDPVRRSCALLGSPLALGLCDRVSQVGVAKISIVEIIDGDSGNPILRHFFGTLRTDGGARFFALY